MKALIHLNTAEVPHDKHLKVILVKGSKNCDFGFVNNTATDELAVTLGTAKAAEAQS